jgi:hypothetical protein
MASGQISTPTGQLRVYSSDILWQTTSAPTRWLRSLGVDVPVALQSLHHQQTCGGYLRRIPRVLSMGTCWPNPWTVPPIPALLQ